MMCCDVCTVLADVCTVLASARQSCIRVGGSLSSPNQLCRIVVARCGGGVIVLAAFIAFGPWGPFYLNSRCLDLPGSRHRHSQEEFP